MRVFIVRGLLECPKGVDLADVVHQGVQPPLYIHFPFRTQREAVHVFVNADVGKIDSKMHKLWA